MSLMDRVLLRGRQVAAMVRERGLARTLAAIWHRLRHGPAVFQPIDVFGHFDFVERAPIAAVGPAARPNSLLWFVPDFNVGSGGHTTIFRQIWHLERAGYHCGIVIVRSSVHRTAEDAKHDIDTYFFRLQAPVYMGFEALPRVEFAVATSWDTAYAVRAFDGAAHKIYFVQDFEPFFYPLGSEYVLAENTYRFGFFAITAGDWLADKVAREYGMAAHAISFGVDLEHYRRIPRREPDVRQVFFYARPPTPRRAFELGLLVLHEVWRRLPDTRFVLAGWDTSNYRVPFPHLACGTVTVPELADLYNQCDVALVLSLTNLSLLPLELMACGCAVVSNRGPNVEWLLDDEIAVLTDATVPAMASALCELLTDDDRRRALTAHAQEVACGRSWEAAARQFEEGLRKARGAA